ncbi:MAG: hypothetical protein HQL89_12850 [Magnetococcales bacterium]|nr:hypothetical protein [Magnetococcales bacterium]
MNAEKCQAAREINDLLYHGTKDKRVEHMEKFEDEINMDPCGVADQYWIDDSLDPEISKSSISRSKSTCKYHTRSIPPNRSMF